MRTERVFVSLGEYGGLSSKGRGYISMEKKTKDFIFSFVLMILGLYVAVGGYLIYKRAALPPYNITQLNVSPGLLPVILGITLILCSALLCIRSLDRSDGLKDALRHKCADIKGWIDVAFHDKGYLFAIGGVAIMALYTFVLLKFLPFWISSILFLVGVMLYLRAGKFWKIALSSCGAVGLVVLLFQVCFQAVLP